MLLQRLPDHLRREAELHVLVVVNPLLRGLELSLIALPYAFFLKHGLALVKFKLRLKLRDDLILRGKLILSLLPSLHHLHPQIRIILRQL